MCVSKKEFRLSFLPVLTPEEEERLERWKEELWVHRDPDEPMPPYTPLPWDEDLMVD